MRSAILHLAFDGLGAAEAHSEAALDNAGSNGVSRRREDIAVSGVEGCRAALGLPW